MVNIINHRGSLVRTLKALGSESITVGFIGGSITDGRVGWNWPEPLANWLVEQYPGCRVTVENAAIGATGSDLAVFRAQRDLLERDCDLVFIEFAVNDISETTEQRNKTREGLIRKLLEGSGRDVIIVYTYCQDMYKDMMAGNTPATIAEFELLAEHYSLGSVWMGLHAFEEVKKGKMKWEEWLPDGLHPQFRGSAVYAESVIQYLSEELNRAKDENPIASGAKMPVALFPDNWQGAKILPMSQVSLEGPWKLKRWTSLSWMDLVLETAAVGAKLRFQFEGRGVSLGFDFGKTSAEFKYRLDCGEWVEIKRDRPDWVQDSGWYRITNIAGDLPAGLHEFELEVIHGDSPSCKGTNFVLALIGIV